MERWSIRIQKDYLKFSAAHFLIFPDGTAERLHGHNYKVFVEVESNLDPHGLVLNFKEIKPLVREVCDRLDEHVLIPGRHPVLVATRGEDGSTEVCYRERVYRIPSEEVLILPVSNTSAENLAWYVGQELVAGLRARFPALVLKRITVGIEETPGQRGIWESRE